MQRYEIIFVPLQYKIKIILTNKKLNNMYVICYIDLKNNQKWELISGEDAMQERVCELCNELNCEEDEIFVFDKDDEIM